MTSRMGLIDSLGDVSRDAVVVEPLDSFQVATSGRHLKRRAAAALGAVLM